MPNITYQPVEDYLRSMLPERIPVLQEMERQAEKRDIPIVGPAVGGVLYQYATLIGAKSVFEMGSAIGYSTIWWALAVGERGRVVYTDGDEKNAREAEGYFRQAGVLDRIDIRVGDAVDLLSRDTSRYDVLFNDIDKQGYPSVFKIAANHVRKGGLFISDNVLWSGRVCAGSGNTEPTTRSIAEFNQNLKKSSDWFTTILPLRDGLAVAMRT